MKASTGYNGGTYTLTQQVFCLSWASSLSFNLKGDAGQIARATKAKLLAVLGNSRVQELIGAWDIVWGPGVYADSIFGEKQSVNCMYIAAPACDPTQAVVVIAGTNGPSLMTWLLQNFNVRDTVPWPYAKKRSQSESSWGAAFGCNDRTGSTPRISKGTAYGLDKLVNIVCSSRVCGRAITAREYLANGSHTNIVVTGHSLGGALSPCYTLYLEEVRDTWDPSRCKRLRCLPTAGASPGNESFSKYYDRRLPDSTKRVWNTMDPVPRAFNVGTLRKVPTLYDPPLYSPLATSFVWALLEATRSRDYVNILPKAPGFPSKLFEQEDFASEQAALAKDIEAFEANLERELTGARRGLIPFFTQALTQHTVGYIVYFKIESFAQLMAEITKQTCVSGIDCAMLAKQLDELLTLDADQPALLDLGTLSEEKLEQLKAGDGPILDDIIAQVKQENERCAKEDAQMVIFLVEEAD